MVSQYLGRLAQGISYGDPIAQLKGWEEKT
jgi:hypothetical protein